MESSGDSSLISLMGKSPGTVEVGFLQPFSFLYRTEISALPRYTYPPVHSPHERDHGENGCHSKPHSCWCRASVQVETDPGHHHNQAGGDVHLVGQGGIQSSDLFHRADLYSYIKVIN